MTHRLFLTLIACVAVVADSARAQDDSTVYYFNADWSPDGTRIAFASGLNGALSIYTIDLDGNGLTRLTDDQHNDEGPVWSPDGESIAFFSNRRERRDELPISLQIYVMKADGTEQRRITHDGPALEYGISWSPDGNRLVFQSRPEINPGVHSLYIIGTDGMGRRRLTDGQYNDYAPQWSPDGTLILFTQSAPSYKFFGDPTREDRQSIAASAEIMVVNPEDGTIMPITQNDLPNSDPSWSGDGSEIFYFQHDGQNKTLFRQGLGHSDAVAVAAGNVLSNSGIPRTRLSPKGRYLAYAKEVNGVYGVYIYDLELEQERRVVGASPSELDSGPTSLP